MSAVRCVLVISLCLLACAAQAAPAAKASPFTAADPPASFRGLAWKTPLEKVTGLSPVPGKGYENTYYRPDEDLQLDDAAIKSVAYYFHNGLFYRVGILFEGQVNHYYLSRALLKKYGRAKRWGTKLGWIWPAFSIQLDFDYATKRGALYYTFEGPLEN